MLVMVSGPFTTILVSVHDVVHVLVLQACAAQLVHVYELAFMVMDV